MPDQYTQLPLTNQPTKKAITPEQRAKHTVYMREWYARRRITHPAEPKPLIAKRCAHCQREFVTPNKKRIYCSPNCHKRASDARHVVGRICKYCGKTFTIPRATQNTTPAIYCSHSCRGKDKCGPDSPSWQGGKREINQRARGHIAAVEWRHAVYERDNYTCQDCGERGGKLNAHHIKPWAKHPELRLDLSNGVTLCKKCHTARHVAEWALFYESCVLCGRTKSPHKSRGVCNACYMRRKYVPKPRIYSKGRSTS